VAATHTDDAARVATNATGAGARAGNAAADAGTAAGNSLRHTPDQQAVVELATEAKRTGGVTSENANTLIDWANEYGMVNHGPEIHLNRPGPVSSVSHIHIGPINHIPIIG
jgi:hypothetical protein